MAAASIVVKRAALVLRWQPEWKAAIVVVGAWALLLAGFGGHAGMSGPSQMRAMGGMSTTDPGEADVLIGLADWTLMCVAMMVPITLRAVGYVARNSFYARRNRAMTLYLVAYVSVWVALGVVVLNANYIARHAFGATEPVLLALTLAVAACWQVTRAKRRALYACGRTLALPPVGLRADKACVRFAWLEGLRCVKSCWPLMAIMAVASRSSIVLMPGLTALVVLEELTVVGRRIVHPIAAVLAVAAVASSLVAVLGGPGRAAPADGKVADMKPAFSTTRHLDGHWQSRRATDPTVIGEDRGGQWALLQLGRARHERTGHTGMRMPNNVLECRIDAVLRLR